ncbi:type II toxin-antitoxin system HipA family toxin [Longimicrobium sp.]|uniref:type II toxin-antitoxin system HipA family toxin n=1 Tax=Longimicrobium sp. TaxID=2029185 RepID=UPI002F91CD9D
MTALEVRLADARDVRVGRLVPHGRVVAFEYEPAFLETGLQLSPLHLPLRPGVFEAPATPFSGLHGVFNDSLPDGWGLLLMDRAFRQRGITREAITAADRLSYLGRRGMGALTYHPETGPDDDGRAVDLAELAAQSERLLEGSGEEVLPELMRAGGSPGGARPKVVVAYRERDGSIVSGSDEVPEGCRAYIVKFGSREDPPDAGAIELAYAAMARAAGIDVPPARLFETRDGGRFFGAERFDRPDGERRHVHTLAGLLNADYRLPSLDYEGYLRTAWALTNSHGAVKAAFRRMVFNVLAHNRDDHAKNFAFLMQPDGTWELTPAYDLTFSGGPGGEHTMAVAGEGRAPGAREFEQVAARMSIPPRESKQIQDEVAAAVAEWPRFAGEAGVSRPWIKRIQERLKTISANTNAEVTPSKTVSRRGRRGK